MPQKKINSYTVKFETDEEPGYTVTVPALPEVITEGRTLAEAEQMAQDAIRGALEVRREKGAPIPHDIPAKSPARSSFFAKVKTATH